MIQTEAQVDVGLPRQNEIALFYFLARAFLKPPDHDFLKMASKEDFVEVLCSLSDAEEEESLKCLLELPREKLLEILLYEYSQLFSVPAEKYVPPYESYYKDKWKVPSIGVVEGLLYGETTVSVNKLYQEEGLKVDETMGELPDHISCEIAFLCVLLEKKRDAKDKGYSQPKIECQKKTQEFLSTHIIPFSERFLENVEKKAGLPFYPALCRILSEALKNIYKGGLED